MLSCILVANNRLFNQKKQSYLWLPLILFFGIDSNNSDDKIKGIEIFGNESLFAFSQKVL